MEGVERALGVGEILEHHVDDAFRRPMNEFDVDRLGRSEFLLQLASQFGIVGGSRTGTLVYSRLWRTYEFPSISPRSFMQRARACDGAFTIGEPSATAKLAILNKSFFHSRKITGSLPAVLLNGHPDPDVAFHAVDLTNLSANARIHGIDELGSLRPPLPVLRRTPE